VFIDVLGSGSDGNGYVIRTSDQYLLLECGVHPKEMLKAIRFEVSKVAGCLCTHDHRDHHRYFYDYQRYGFPVEMHLPRMKKHRMGDFTIVPFQVPHNETDCDGFLIQHREFGSLVFITDAEMCPFDLSGIGIDHLMVECNYSADYIDRELENFAHIVKGHMELQTCKRFIQSVNSPKLKSIGLIHLSKRNADPARFLSEIETEFPDAHVWVASKGKTIKL
jgi:phosphoribosyl 1,2-cyclic phosphodiesterase